MTEGLIQRTFPAEFTPGDGRTVDVRIVPYGVAARVSDDGRTTYQEEWQSGCFDDQLVAGHRLKVLMNFEHLEGLTNVIGRGVALRSDPDALHGSFRIMDTSDGDKALHLIEEGILDGVSLEAHPKKSIRTAAGVIKRVKAHLVNVALCRTPAFAGAQVLAVRQEPIALDEDLLPVPIDPELVERCRLLGVKLPQRLAHPANTGTSAETDTPEDGTRHEDPVQPSSEVPAT
jgi:HK97 family phage prohead protease